MAQIQDNVHRLSHDVEVVEKVLEQLRENLVGTSVQGRAQAEDKDYVGFVLAAEELLDSNPDIFPASFDKSRMKETVALIARMIFLENTMGVVRDEIRRAIKSLADDSIRDAMKIYKYTRLAAEDFPLLSSATDRLAEIYWKQQKPGAATQTPMRVAK